MDAEAHPMSLPEVVCLRHSSPYTSLILTKLEQIREFTFGDYFFVRLRRINDEPVRSDYLSISNAVLRGKIGSPS